jgi:phenylacetic acid degradation operon negative regulatory protein
MSAAMQPPRARSFVLDLVGTLRGGSMPVRTLVDAGALFGLSAGTIRVAVTRLQASGHIERDERGSYRLGVATRVMATHIAAWQRAPERRSPWNGDWIGVLARGDARGRRDDARILELWGLRQLAGQLWVRPANLVEATQGVRRGLAEAGAGGSTTVFTLRDLDPADEARARALWPTQELDRGYRDTIDRLRASARRLAASDDPAAMVESFRLGGQAIRLVVRDPLLPDEMIDGHSLVEMVEELRRYDRMGRTRWARFLEGYGLRTMRTPMDGTLMENDPRRAALVGGEVEEITAYEETRP